MVILATLMLWGCSKDSNNPVAPEQTYFIQYLVATDSPTIVTCSEGTFSIKTFWISNGQYLRKGDKVGVFGLQIEIDPISRPVQWTVAEVLVDHKSVYSNGGMGYAKVDTTL